MGIFCFYIMSLKQKKLFIVLLILCSLKFPAYSKYYPENTLVLAYKKLRLDLKRSKHLLEAFPVPVPKRCYYEKVFEHRLKNQVIYVRAVLDDVNSWTNNTVFTYDADRKALECLRRYYDDPSQNIHRAVTQAKIICQLLIRE